GVAWTIFDRFADRSANLDVPGRMVLTKGSPLAFMTAGRSWRSAIVWKDFHFISGGNLVLGLKLFISITMIVWALKPWANRPPTWPNVGMRLLGPMATLLLLEL